MRTLIFILFTSGLVFSGCGSSKKATEQDNVDLKDQKDSVQTEKKPVKKLTIADFLHEYIEIKYPERDFSDFSDLIYVSVKHQRLFLIRNKEVIKRYPVSTAEKGTGNRKNSYKTPVGLHRVEKKIGKGVPPGGLFQSRVYTGKKAEIYTDKVRSKTDDITSRIMWLSGLEEKVNKGKRVDSYQRHIYIHGTSEEGYIGSPASHGCIRMKNEDVIELFPLVKEGTPVLILSY